MRERVHLWLILIGGSLVILATIALLGWLDYSAYIRTHINATWWTWLLNSAR